MCRDIHDVIWNATDSEPFREPVDPLELPGKLPPQQPKFKFIEVGRLMQRNFVYSRLPTNHRHPNGSADNQRRIDWRQLRLTGRLHQRHAPHIHEFAQLQHEQTISGKHHNHNHHNSINGKIIHPPAHTQFPKIRPIKIKLTLDRVQKP